MIDIEQIKSIIANEQLQSERLIIRRFAEQDMDIEIAQQQDAQVMRYIRPPLDLEAAEEFARNNLKPWRGEDGQWVGLTVIRKSDGHNVGALAFRFYSREFAIAELGYRFLTDYQGQGYASEALATLVACIFTRFELHKIMAMCDPHNVASYKVMEKVGMIKEGHLRQHYKIGDQYSDELVYGLLASDYTRHP